MTPAPHGGRLVGRELPEDEVVRLESQRTEFPVLRPEADQLLDAVQLARGAYSPLDGFMDRATLESVLATGRLPSSIAWPVPVVLTPPGAENAATLRRVRPGDEVALLDPTDHFVARLTVRELFPLDKTAVARSTYGTLDASHPNVAALATTGPIAVAGRVDLLRPPRVPFPELELGPAQARSLFRKLGWTHVAGFQTRNLPHAGHEQLHRLTLERSDIDGLFLHPVIGPRRSGDYPPEAVIGAYRELAQRWYPPERTRLATLTVGMRYAGPKAALFFAIVRQNFGCTHYIVGRDQAGVGGFYDPYACHQIFDEFPLEIIPLRYQELGYCRACGGMVSDRSCRHGTIERLAVSQTAIRAALADGRPIPSEIFRPELRPHLPPRGPAPGPVPAAAPAPLPEPSDVRTRSSVRIGGHAVG